MKKLITVIPVLLVMVSCSMFEEVSSPQSETERLKDKVAVLDAEIIRLRKVNDELRTANSILKAGNLLYDDISDELKKAISDLMNDGVERLPNGSYSFGVDLLFAPGSAKIHAEGTKVVNKFVSMWKSKDVRFKIVGHTDKDPIVKTAHKYKSKTNLELGMERSLKVMELFVNNGVRESQIVIASAGNNEPIAPNDDSPANKKRNRRVEIFVLKGGETTSSDIKK